jgi:hypothetical protein
MHFLPLTFIPDAAFTRTRKLLVPSTGPENSAWRSRSAWVKEGTDILFNKAQVFATLLALSLITTLTFNTTQTTNAAPPSDGVYDIAVLDVGSSFDWGEDDFQAFTANEYDWEMIQPDDLTASNLDGFDVLIIPWSHDYSWLTPQMASAIMGFVNSGGTLIIHSTYCGEVCPDALPEGFQDALLAFFPPEYFIDWFVGGYDETVLIINPSHALATRPNALTGAGLSNWGDSIHSFIGAWGEAWQWVLATDFTSQEEGEVGDAAVRQTQSDELSTQEIVPGVDVAMVQGCARFGDGVVVVSGQDPEYHGTNNDEPEAYLQIENEIKLGDVGCGNDRSRDRDDRQRQQPPNIGAGLSGLFNGMPTPLPTAPSAVAPAATSPVITPPRTGDAGLAGDDGTPFYVAAAVALVLAAIPAYRLARR